MKESRNSHSKLKALLKNIDRSGPIKIGLSRRTVEFQKDEMVLYKYESTGATKNNRPILLVYSLVNRPEIADLSSERSLIKELCDFGFPVYLIDWGDPGDNDAEVELSTYIIDYLGSAVDYIRGVFPKEAIDVIGLCQGGTFAVCYASLFPEKISSLITTATPIDFHSEKDRLSALIRHVDLKVFEKFPKTIDGRMLNFFFLFLKPYKLLQKKYFDLIENGHDLAYVQNFLKMEKWIFDSPAISSSALMEFVSTFYQKNALVEKTLFLNGLHVEPSDIRAPILNIFASNDHIVPIDSSKALARLITHPDYSEIEMDCGHVGLYVGKSARRSTGGVIAAWLDAQHY